MALKNKYIFKVIFNNGEEYHFDKLSLIYDRFSPSEIGCKIKRLWNLKVSQGNVYQGRRCTIIPIQLYKYEAAKVLDKSH